MKEVVIALVLPLALLVGLALPAFAEDGLEPESIDEQARELAQTEAERLREAAKDRAEALREKAKDEAERIREEAKQLAEQRKEEIETKREEIKERVQERKAELNQEQCERNQERIEQRLPQLSQSANTQQRVLDTMYARVAGFYESGQLTVSNYEGLVASVETQKLELEDAVTLLGESVVEVDCSASGLGDELSRYRESVRVVQSEVKQYRTALVDLIKSMKAAAEDSSVDEGDQSTSGEEQSSV